MEVSFLATMLWVLAEVGSGLNLTCGVGRKCEFYEFQCDSGQCLNMRHYCDGIKDCPDGSDEYLEEGENGCRNPLNNATSKCKLPKQYECDGMHHCENKVDENDSICNETFRMSCNKYGHCINKLFLNCAHRPEWSCPEKFICNGPTCSRWKGVDDMSDIGHECGSLLIFRCNSGQCLDQEKFCDGVVDCDDGSDEIPANLTKEGDGLLCSNKWNSHKAKCLLPSGHICDKIDHCDNREDECQAGCEYSFFCDNGKCLSLALPFTCNGRDDCGDSSDECSDRAKCRGSTFSCKDGTCIAMDLFCNGRRDCPDGSDEISSKTKNDSQLACSAKHNPFPLECVLPEHHRCDGDTHCDNSVDEWDGGECTRKPLFECNNTYIVDSMAKICNFKDDCCDSSDECGIPGCNRTFICPDNGKCIAFERFCDGVDDCDDGSDEISVERGNSSCKNLHNNFNKACQLPPMYLCDNLDHCEERTDECGSDCHNSFFCNNGQCIDRKRFCDGRQDCSDNSDELASVPGFKCHVTHQINDISRSCVIPQKLLFDDLYDCRDMSDDCVGNGSCFKCLTLDFYISPRQVCDGVMDCPDLSDECSCITQNETVAKICNNFCTLNDLELCSGCGRNSVLCDEGTTCISLPKVCDGVVDCSDGADENACKAEESKNWSANAGNFKCATGNPEYGIACDGIPQCQFAEDECQLKEGENVTFMCGSATLGVCNTSTRVSNSVVTYCTIKNLTRFLSHEICDGVEDCEKPANGELSVDERGCKDRWKCFLSRPKERGKSTIHISRICDGEIDCEGEEDEEEKLCQEERSRFYCENRGESNGTSKLGPLFVSSQAVYNGKSECWDGSDECPSKLFQQNTFSSRHRMIRSIVLSVFIWIMGILASLGNLVVMWHSVTKLRSRRRFSTTMKSNYVLIFNLAVADFLMGVYLLMLAVQNSQTDGSYCKYDRDWRSGATCAALGSLATISLQASVCFLVLLTTYRMLTVLNPFNADLLQVRYTLGFVFLTWFLSLILAIIPRVKDSEEYFVSSVLISPGVFFFDTNTPTKTELGKFAKTLMSYSNVSTPEGDLFWPQIHEAIATLYPTNWPELKLTNEFGYYSAHSVCLPKFFVKVNDSAWAFSLGIMIFDFLSFCYIFTAYIVIYNDASRQGALGQNKKAADENKTLQARITRLVLADFLCLVPVCSTAFFCISGYEINPVIYAVAAIVLLPINSALNPILYSNVIGVLYSSCVNPAFACVAKPLWAKRGNPFAAGPLPVQHEPLSSDCRWHKTTKSSTDTGLESERVRLGSSDSTITINQPGHGTSTALSKL